MTVSKKEVSPMVEEQTTPRYTRRSVLLRGAGSVAALSGAPALLAACGGSSSGSSKSFTAWWWGDPTQMPAWLNTVVAKFKAEKGVSITVNQQQTTSFAANFTAAAAARQGPSVAAQWATMPVMAPAWKGAITPLNAYVPQSELAHWIFRQENLYKGKYYAMPLYVIGSPFALNKKLFEQAGLDPTNPPKTWDQFLATCATLKKKGITPFAMGNSDTFGGRWAFSFLGVQNLDSLDELRAALLGEVSFAEPKYSQWMSLWKELNDKGYFNSDANSIDSTHGWNIFLAGKAAFCWATDSFVLGWGKALGNENVIPIKFPVFGTGKLASAYTATQSCSYFLTSWGADPAVGAEFLKFFHEPAQQKSLFEQCQVLPADDRFDRSLVVNPLQKTLVEHATTGLQVWLENWIPPSFDDSANGVGGQKLMTGGSVQSVAALWDEQAKAWREQNPTSAKNFASWQLTPVTV
jgi:ABC-type glycerol-3-phosphate transport system substrate-binding protein